MPTSDVAQERKSKTSTVGSGPMAPLDSSARDTQIKNHDYENSDVVFRFLDYLSQGEPTPPPQPRPTKTQTAPQLVTRHVELAVTYHTLETFCKKCTKLQGKKIGGQLALQLRPLNKLQHLGTYGKVSKGPIRPENGLPGKIHTTAARRGWQAVATITHPSWDTADEIFSQLMGEDVVARRRFIQQNAADVRFLDV